MLTLDLLAQSSSSSAVTWSLILVVVLVVGFAAVLQIKKWLMAGDEPQATGFTLSDLRRMRKEGSMTEEEFEKAKALIVGVAKSPRDKPAEPRDPGVGNSSQI